jgi:hypothetical protein
LAGLCRGGRVRHAVIGVVAQPLGDGVAGPFEEAALVGITVASAADATPRIAIVTVLAARVRAASPQIPGVAPFAVVGGELTAGAVEKVRSRLRSTRAAGRLSLRRA